MLYEAAVPKRQYRAILCPELSPQGLRLFWGFFGDFLPLNFCFFHKLHKVSGAYFISQNRRFTEFSRTLRTALAGLNIWSCNLRISFPPFFSDIMDTIQKHYSCSSYCWCVSGIVPEKQLVQRSAEIKPSFCNSFTAKIIQKGRERKNERKKGSVRRQLEHSSVFSAWLHDPASVSISTIESRCIVMYHLKNVLTVKRTYSPGLREYFEFLTSNLAGGKE